MCWLCEQYGEGGGLWYLNPKNYARNMYKLRAPGEESKGAEADPEAAELEAMSKMVEALGKGPEAYALYKKGVQEHRRRRGMGAQIVPLADADRVLELSSPIGLLACICRKRVRAIDERNENQYTCMGMGVGMLKWERWPERYKGGVKFVNVDEAKEWNHEMDRRGFVHILMLFGAPFIGGFCQCDYPECDLIRRAVDFDLGTMRSHYVAQVNYNQCNGCGVCAQRCQFGALKFEVTTDKANIDPFKCYGCGICETGCPRKAIQLIERKNIPMLAEVW